MLKKQYVELFNQETYQQCKYHDRNAISFLILTCRIKRMNSWGHLGARIQITARERVLCFMSTPALNFDRHEIFVDKEFSQWLKYSQRRVPVSSGRAF